MNEPCNERTNKSPQSNEVTPKVRHKTFGVQFTIGNAGIK